MADSDTTSDINTGEKQPKLLHNGLPPTIGAAHQFQPGVSGNPAGKPKGSRHLRTVIQELMEDEDFELKLKNGEILKGAPSKHISQTMYKLALSGNVRAADWLAKNGYPAEKEPEPTGNTYNTQVNISNTTGETMVKNFEEFMMQQTLPQREDASD